jgi:hypothetical protein
MMARHKPRDFTLGPLQIMAALYTPPACFSPDDYCFVLRVLLLTPVTGDDDNGYLCKATIEIRWLVKTNECYLLNRRADFLIQHWKAYTI